MPDPSVSPTLDLQLTWRGTTGRIRFFEHGVRAETSFEQDGRTQVPMERVTGWRVEPCDVDAVCVEFVTDDTVYRVLLDTADERLARLGLERTLGAPLPTEG